MVERPRLSNISYKGIRKSEADELGGKTGLVKGQVVTENRKRNAVEAIEKFYAEKGFRNATTRIEEQVDKALANSVALTLHVDKGRKVRVNEINFYGNESISDTRLKKQLKGTKEMTKLTLYPSEETGPYGVNTKMSFGDFLSKKGYLVFKRIQRIP